MKLEGALDVEPEALAKRGKPLIKWPGGKRGLLHHLLKFVPQSFETYYEPFFGGGALFFALQPKKAILSDVNDELINCYQQVRDFPEQLIRILRKLENNEETYYRLREKLPGTDFQRAARILFLTRLSFNGIHRVNLKGEFNVPYGKKTYLSSVDVEQLRRTSLALTSAKIKKLDFEEATFDAKRGDFVYFDPPYTVAHAQNGFVKYNEKIFSWGDQERLAKHARKLIKRGCTVVVSNADHSSLHDLYWDFKRQVIERPSVIAASKEHRKIITECIFSSNE